METEESKPDNDEYVTLVLGEHRIKANKAKLSRYSLYFNSLFSENYNDHRQTEFRINYEMSLSTLQDFVHWANSEGEHTRVVHSPKYFCIVRASLEKFLTVSYGQLLELLELSVVFMAEKLTGHIIDMLICMKLPPDTMLEIWQLSESLGLNMLRDVALATCIERFDELPNELFLNLSIEHFTKLVFNVNLKCSPARLLAIREEWIKHNGFSTENPALYSKYFQCDSETLERRLKRKKPRQMQCIASLTSSSALSLFAWNIDTIEHLASMTDEKMHSTFHDNRKDIVGRQVVGRGFKIYLVGGEQGIGTGRFNPALWRYCLFSKKWYIESFYPRPRRHMAVALIGDKLYLFGGVGRNRLKLKTVDVFHVYTGLWTRAADIPEAFTEVPASFVVNDKFVYYKSKYYVYDPKTDQWSSRNIVPEDKNLLNDYQIPIRSIIGYRNDRRNNTFVYVSDVLPDRDMTFLRRFVLGTPGSTVQTETIHQWRHAEEEEEIEEEAEEEQEEQDQEQEGGEEQEQEQDGEEEQEQEQEKEGGEEEEGEEEQEEEEEEDEEMEHEYDGMDQRPQANVYGDFTFFKQLMDGRKIIGIACKNDRMHVEIGKLRVDKSAETLKRPNQVPETYRRITMCVHGTKNALEHFFQFRLGCFNLIDPNTLHSVIKLPEKESINV